jgi:hypothetical protein
VTPAIRWGGFGELAVIVDGRPVFSKRRAGRLPQPGEIIRLVEAPAPPAAAQPRPPDHPR